MPKFSATARALPVNTAVALAKIKAAVLLSVEQSCALVVEEAKAIVPVDTGALRDSIQYEIGEAAAVFKIIGFVSATAPYAAFVEYGTGIRGAGTYPYPLPQTGVPYTGAWTYDWRGKGWKGHVASPFVRPAVELARGPILEIFRENLKGAA